jgi:hypothetical protein
MTQLERENDDKEHEAKKIETGEMADGREGGPEYGHISPSPQDLSTAWEEALG